jgi:hypothetical protein
MLITYSRWLSSHSSVFPAVLENDLTALALSFQERVFLSQMKSFVELCGVLGGILEALQVQSTG